IASWDSSSPVMNSSFDSWDSSSYKDALWQCDVSASWTLCLQLAASWTLCLQLAEAGLFIYSFVLIKSF
ncbi:18068_t:CDS:1, partial [Dentiscutata erythropus]